MSRETVGYKVRFNIGNHHFDETGINSFRALDLTDKLDKQGITYSISTGQYVYGSGVLVSSNYIDKSELRDLCTESKSERDKLR